MITLTLFLQGDPLDFTPLQAGATFAIYASGFATASLTWTRMPARHRDRLPVAGALLMGSALLGIGLASADDHWAVTVTTPLLFAGGVGHAWGFSPLANRLTSSIGGANAADMSGFILTASVIGQAIGVAVFTGVYLSHAPGGPGSALALTTGAIAAASILTAACARMLRRGAPAEALRPRATGVCASPPRPRRGRPLRRPR